ncbi:MAG: SUMF1/EgtB/PvdO family nonheme iron enzyme [Planctomycetota bacterium]|nr:SUMF1/EgtB/PvdO family nonheme iron enzyme [Planctomycetota bacterium]
MSDLRNEPSPAKSIPESLDTTKVIVLWDFTIRGLRKDLQGLKDRPPEGTELFVPAEVGSPKQGEIFRDIVKPAITDSTRALAVVDLPNANVGFEIGFALGSRLEVALACAAGTVPEWLDKPPLKAFGVEPARGVKGLRAILSSEPWIAPIDKAEPGNGVLFVCPDADGGEVLVEEVGALRPKWRRLPADGWTLNDLSDHLRGIGTVVWAIATHKEGDEGRDGAGNAAASVVAGLALAHDLKLEVFRDSDAREVVDVKHKEKVFTSIPAFRKLIEDVNRPAKAPTVPRDPLIAYRAYLRTTHDRLVTFFPQASDVHLCDVHVELDFEPCQDETTEGLHEQKVYLGGPGFIGAWKLAIPSGGKARCTLKELLAPPVQASGLPETGGTALQAPAPRWVILGEPGAGKTTSARHLCWQLAAEEAGSLPVFVSLSQATAEKERRHPFQVVEDAVRQGDGDLGGSGISDRLHELSSHPGSLLLLLDGLDEVAPEQRARALELIAHWSQRLPHVSIAVTSRPIGFQDITGFRRASLRPLSEDSQRRLLSLWLDKTKGREAWERIQTRPSLRSIAQNPLMLTLIASLSEERGDLPPTRTRLYSWAIDLLLKKGFGQTPKGVRDPHSARKLLAALCLRLQDSTGEQWSEGELEERLFELEQQQPELRARWHGTWISRAEFLDDVAQNSGLLGALDGPNTPWKFPHRQLREFLAAEALAELGDSELLVVTRGIQEEDIPRWAETLGMHCSLAKDPHEAILTISAMHPEAALRALPEVDGLDPARSLDYLIQAEQWNFDDLVRLARAWRSFGRSRQEVTELLLARVADLRDDPERKNRADRLSRLGMFHLVMAREGMEPERQVFLDACELDWVKAPELVFERVPEGKFTMGSPEEEQGPFDWEGPEHAIRVSAFELARHPVTEKQFAGFAALGGSEREISAEKANMPATDVSWWQAYLFCLWIDARLPSESQWEYACRAGQETRYWSGNEESDLADVGWYAANSGGELHSVGEKRANDFGLYDMHGNVCEWCQDNWSEGYEESQGVHPQAFEDGSSGRVIRGGSFNFPAGGARSAYRFRYPAEDRGGYLGFRPARVSTS